MSALGQDCAFRRDAQWQSACLASCASLHVWFRSGLPIIIIVDIITLVGLAHSIKLSAVGFCVCAAAGSSLVDMVSGV